MAVINCTTNESDGLRRHPSGKMGRLPENRGVMAFEFTLLFIKIGSWFVKGEGCRERALPPRLE